MEPLEIDGSYGEGGGQILRTAIAFSIIQRRPVRVSRIRAGRENPGLRRQHTSALRILQEVSGGRLEGAKLGSSSITFSPGVLESSSIKIDMETAASITLVLQAVVPAVSLSGSSLELQLIGGTDVPWSPTWDYFEGLLVPALGAIGVKCRVEAPKRGYYPKGGGLVRASIEPCRSLDGLDLIRREANPGALIRSRCGRLPSHVAERQCSSSRAYLESHRISLQGASVSQELSDSPGSSILVSSLQPNLFLGSDSIGAIGKSAESVGREAAATFVPAYRSGACIDAHLADTLAPLLSLASSQSRLLVPEITEHLKTSLYVAQLFTGCAYGFSTHENAWLVTIDPRKHNL